MLIDEKLIRDHSISEYFDIHEPKESKIVLGHSRTIEGDVFEENCKKDNIQIIKRISGGGTVLLAPGMLVWTLLVPTKEICLNQSKWFHLFSTWIINSLSSTGIQNLEVKGTSDLTINNKKISGTALYIGAKKVLYHGTLLIDIDIDLFEKYLKIPDRIPDYRENRKHIDFVTTLKNSGYEIDKEMILKVFRESTKPTEEDYGKE